MIFYFSGTGNSKWVAEELGKQLDEKVLNMADVYNESDKVRTFEKEERIGLVFPVYAWAPPEMVMEFIKYLKIKDAYTFAVCTCGEEVGLALERLNKELPLKVAYSIVMPNNYIVAADIDSVECQQAKIQKARLKIKEITEQIVSNSNTWDVQKGKLPWIKSYPIAFMFNKFARMTKPFYATEKCNGCGLCEQICPAKTIQLIEGKPVWDKKCYQCLGCLHRCPQKAIQYGKSTESKGRYYLK